MIVYRSDRKIILIKEGSSLAKLTEFTNPLSGNKGNVFDFGSLWSNVLGVFVLIIVFAFGQKLAGVVSKKVPVVATSIQDPFTPAPVTPAQKRVI